MLLQRSERVLETIPVGSLGLIPLDSCKELGQKVNDYLVEWRHDSQLEHKSNIVLMVLLLSIATSIDALAVGVTFSCMNYPTLSSILMPVAIIGLTSTLLSVVGYLLGIFLGKKTNFQIEIVGGAILIIIGLKILYEHLILQ